MEIAAYFIAFTLSFVSLLHVAWAFGVCWPADNEQMLIKTVIGHPNVKKMPSRSLTLCVAFGIALAGLVALVGGHIVNIPAPNWMVESALILLILIFVGRGLSSYLIDGPLGKRIEPFATLDRRYFAPLCLIICACYIGIYLAR